MKRLFLILISSILLVLMAACGPSPETDPTAAPQTPTPTPTLTAPPTTAPSPTTTVTPTMQPSRTPTVTPTPTPTSAPITIISRVWEKDGMEQVFVPAGEFSMGHEAFYLQPVHTVYLDAYWIDKTEITNAMFTQFVSETHYWTDAEKDGKGYIWATSGYKKTYGASWEHPQGLSSDIQSKEQWPVTQVSWDDATAYCAWAGKRLPTEAEWEKAARGTDGRKYPWGNDDPGCNLANIDIGEHVFCVGEAVEVGSYPSGISPYGALDMIGNLWEWVYDLSGPEIYSHQINPTGPDTGFYRVMRGGGWNLGAQSLSVRPFKPADSYGFRCVSPEPAGH